MELPTCLFTTYFIALESELPQYHEQYIKRVDRARDLTEILFVTDWIKGERNDALFEVMMQDLRRDMKEIGNYPFNEEEWGLYSLSCIAVDVEDPAAEGANVSRLWIDLALDEEKVPRDFTSKVRAIDLSKDGRGCQLGEFSF